MGWFNSLLVKSLPLTPKFIVARISKRYVAGESLEQAFAVVRQLNSRGIHCTMDILGEFINNMQQADEYQRQAIELQQRIASEALDSTISIKLTQHGLKIDRQACLQHVRKLAEQARQLNSFVRIDMEDSTCTDDTLDIVEQVFEEYGNVGAVIQAYLHRSMDDIKRLIKKKIPVRVCKGIYVEPPEVAIQDFHAIRENFLALVDEMFAAGVHVGIATHDKYLIDRCIERIRTHGLDQRHYELQMLLGVQERLRDRLVDQGYPMRVYVPFGPDWYAYCLRRMKESPHVAGQVFKAMFQLWS